MTSFKRIAEGYGMRIGRDANGQLMFASKRTGDRFVYVDADIFPALSGPNAEAEALTLHMGMIGAGIPEAIAEEFIAQAGFDVTSL